jgi:hypothetical protein
MRSLQVLAVAYLLLAISQLIWRSDISVLYILGLFGLALVVLFMVNGKLGKGNLWSKWKLVLGFILLLAYLALELFFNYSAFIGEEKIKGPSSNSGFGYFNQSCAEFDLVRGYRWKDGEHRIVKFTGDKVVYDNSFKVNNEGYYANIPYHSFKKDSSVTRYLLVGDSFTSAEFLATPMVDRLNDKSFGMEFYSFSIDGGGIVNWHEIFFKEITGNFEFDALILNVFADDLRRDFFMMHHEENQGYTMYSKDIPKDFTDFKANYLPLADPFAPILRDESIDSMQNHLIMKQMQFSPKFYLPILIAGLPLGLYQKYVFSNFLNSYLINQSHEVTQEEIEGFYDREALLKFTEILEYCKQNNKELILTSIPYEYGIYALNEGKVIKEYAYLEYLAKKNDCYFFDGYKLFSSLPETQISSLYFKGDAHWNQEGSNMFSDNLLTYLQEISND